MSDIETRRRTISIPRIAAFTAVGLLSFAAVQMLLSVLVADKEITFAVRGMACGVVGLACLYLAAHWDDLVPHLRDQP